MGNKESLCGATREDGDGPLDCCECHRIHHYTSEDSLVSSRICHSSVRNLRIFVLCSCFRIRVLV